jgi:MFS family permease
VKRLRESARAFGDVFRNRDLRWLELAWASSIIGSWAYSIAIVVFAFEHGGATAVGLVGLIRWLAGAAVSPFAAVLADRFDRRYVMIAANLTRGTLIAIAAVAANTHAPAVVIYLIAGLVNVAATPFRPAQAALTPALARTPEELTAANVVSSTIESVGIFGGPAIGGVVLAASGASTVFVLTACLMLFSTVLIGVIHAPVQERRAPEPIRQELLAGAQAILRTGRLRLLVGLFAAQTFVDGMLNVLIVVIALELLGSGKAGVGFLNSAVGIGGLLGALLAAVLIGRKRMASDFGLGIFIWGLPIALVAVWPNEVFALVLLGIVGIGNTLVDVSGMTLMQRAAPEEVLARVFGVLESVILVTVGLGAIAAPGLLSLLGTRGALIVAGALLPILVIPAWPLLTAIDRTAAVPAHRLELLRSIDLFAPLPPATLEQLASALVEVDVSAGDTVFHTGDPGDLFYAIDGGTIEVLVDDRPPVVLERGDFFGEIALLRDLPRTATVRARTDAKLYALGRDEFIPAVTGYAPSRAAADRVIGKRLGWSTASVTGWRN